MRPYDGSVIGHPENIYVDRFQVSYCGLIHSRLPAATWTDRSVMQ